MKVKHNKETAYLKVKLDDQITSQLVEVVNSEKTKTLNKKKKFPSIVQIPPYIVFDNKDSVSVVIHQLNSSTAPFFGLNQNSLGNITGRKANEKEKLSLPDYPRSRNKLHNWQNGHYHNAHKSQRIAPKMLEFHIQNPVVEYVLSIIPPIIIWELWRSRCNSRYEEERPSTKRPISLIAFNICHLTKKVFSNINLPENWESLLKLMEIQLEDTIHTTVKWSRPSHHSMKLNTDGSCIGESSGGGGVVRDSNGNCIMAFILPLGNGTSNTAERKAFLIGLKWCIANGHIFTTVETDSLLLLNSILNLWSTPWRMKEMVDEIREVADKLSSYSHLTNTTIVLTDTSDLQAHVKGLLNLDKWQFPSFRIKKRKPSLIYYDPP
ncbi:hypothetical protein R3W88_026195 [Solanum pinnatisectum]|uniref:RNase H type-1 domain-containing protein n=1 Tax=Solanum pinnatisectum TaxID=50273 RepID=A0AAV9LCG3_9SOLN|nr:hypothetical protein R3W88_026195 [Solanum pinnatisectum]